MMAPRRIVWTGLCFLLIEAYLPWVRANPTYEWNLAVGLPGMDSGMETYGLITLILGLITILGLLVDLKWISNSSFRALVGAVAVVTSVFFYIGEYGLLGMYIADVGVYLTFIGGVILLLGGRRSDATTQPRGEVVK